jgi:hypothetical protein
MSRPSSAESPRPDGPPPPSVRELVWDAALYWEGRRVGYNAILTLVTLAWLLFTWPHFRPAMTWHSGLLLLALAAIANVCYSAAYPVDIAFQLVCRAGWRRRRWMLWWAGVAFAGALASYWIADEIYPSFG